ncbi:MAG TPA: ISAzo13 family transposase [Kiritimatiellia bacterium]|nr:ISAzo13 family transposase [Kiritimatiellia bacterium]
MNDIEKSRITTMAKLLPENIRRVYLAFEAQALGYGGLTAISQLTGVSMTTLRVGVKELKDGTVEALVQNYAAAGQAQPFRERAPGAGRPRATQKFKELPAVLEKLLADATFGSPDQPLLWTTKSLRNLEAALRSMGYSVSYRTIGTLLADLGYSLQLNQKNLQVGEKHVDRDAQFQFINARAQEFIEQGEPVISVDAKKKENIGNFIGKGAEYAPKGKPVEVLDHDFPLPTEGKAVPYGVFDMAANEGFVNVGISADTAEFAVESIYQWWLQMGRERYPNARKLFITCDGGGSNGSRNRLWKTSLQDLANRIGMEIFVSHFPPGTSKWNKIEHRMFSQITKNWRGRPLVSMQVIVSLIAATTTSQGLKIQCQSDPNTYEPGKKISDEELAKVNLNPDDFHGDWNYSIEAKMDKD